MHVKHNHMGIIREKPDFTSEKGKNNIIEKANSSQERKVKQNNKLSLPKVYRKLERSIPREFKTKEETTRKFKLPTIFQTTHQTIKQHQR